MSAAAWRIQIGDARAEDLRIADECANGGPLTIEATPGEVISDRQPAAEALFEPPAGTLISSFKIWRYAAANDGPNTPEGETDYAASLREWPVIPGGEGFVSECAVRPTHRCSFGSLDEPFGESNLVTEHTWAGEVVPGEGVPPLEKLGFWVSCVRLGCEPPAEGEGPAAVFDLFGSAIVIEDDHVPVVERIEGSLAAAAPVSGVGTLFVTAADVGGGVADFAFSVDGGAPQRLTTANGTGGCEEPFSAVRPCPATATQGFALDTGALAPGVHTVSGTVVDAAGNATPFGPLDFTVAAPGGGPPVVVQGSVAATTEGAKPNNGTPAVESPRLRIDRATSPRRVGHPARVRGTLTTPDGRPIAEARLLVEVTELGGARRGKPQTVRTDARGHFAVTIKGDGARTVVVSYSPRLGGPVARTADAVVRSPLSLQLKTRPRRVRNGQTVDFVGSLRGAGRAARGAQVEIQAVSGGGWTTVETVTADAHGSFSWLHRFRYVERNALFSFRAVVPRTPGWPWPTVRSLRVKVPIKGAPR